MPYKDKEQAKARRKKYYYEVEKPKKKKEKEKILKRKKSKKINRKKREKEAKKYAWNIKKNNGCSNCSESDPACLVFHHMDPSTKRDSIHNLYKYGLTAVKKEIEKCSILCANCHSIYHYYELKPKENIATSVANLEKSP